MNKFLTTSLSLLLLGAGQQAALAQRQKPIADTLRKANTVTTAADASSSAAWLPRVSGPSSPNAAGLGTFANVPVSAYTGLPTINLPLYTIKYRDLELPLSLSYHAQGIRVDQEASWVGLGWTLNAGGAITRTIRGFDDFYRTNGGGTDARSGYCYVPESIQTNGDQLVLNSFFIKGTWDAEPDLFYLNVAGLSGKFYLSKADANDVMTGTLLSAEKMTIRYYGAAYTGPQGPRSWEVKTAGGITYQFKTIEYTYTKTSGAPVGSVNEADSRCTQCTETERALQEYQTMLSDERILFPTWCSNRLVSLPVRRYSKSNDPLCSLLRVSFTVVIQPTRFPARIGWLPIPSAIRNIAGRNEQALKNAKNPL